MRDFNLCFSFFADAPADKGETSNSKEVLAAPHILPPTPRPPRPPAMNAPDAPTAVTATTAAPSGHLGLLSDAAAKGLPATPVLDSANESATATAAAAAGTSTAAEHDEPAKGKPKRSRQSSDGGVTKKSKGASGS